MNIVDRYFIAKQEHEALTKQLDAMKQELHAMGLGEHAGDYATVTVRENKESTIFDSKQAYEYVKDKLSPQLRTAVAVKFTVIKPGALVVTVKGKAKVTVAA